MTAILRTALSASIQMKAIFASADRAFSTFHHNLVQNLVDCAKLLKMSVKRVPTTVLAKVEFATTLLIHTSVDVPSIISTSPSIK